MVRAGAEYDVAILSRDYVQSRWIEIADHSFAGDLEREYALWRLFGGGDQVPQWTRRKARRRELVRRSDRPQEIDQIISWPHRRFRASLHLSRMLYDTDDRYRCRFSSTCSNYTWNCNFIRKDGSGVRSCRLHPSRRHASIRTSLPPRRTTRLSLRRLRTSNCIQG